MRNDFASFSVPQWAALGLMVVGVVILAMWFMQWSTSPTWELAANGLTPAETADVTGELESAGIDYRLANGGTAVEVPTGSVDDAKVALGDLSSVGGANEGYELLDNQGFLASSFRQRVDYQRAIEGELARTILSMEAVTSATVHLAIPEDRLFSEQQQLTRASVVVGGSLDQSTVASVANVVASAVPGLDPANVTVAATSGRILSGGIGDSGFTSDQRLQMQDLYEAQLELAAESMLSTALGPGRAVVRVTADLNFDELESETVSYETGDQVTLREQTLDEAFTGDNSVPLGTLGTAESVTDAGDLAGEDGSAYLRQEQNSEYGVPTTRTVSRQAPGSVERVTVAVLVDESLEPAPDPAALSALVAAAVGIDDARGDSIVVQTMAFEDIDLEMTEPLPQEAVAADGLETYTGYAKTGAAVLGMLLALLFLRRGLKNLTASVREPVEVDPSTVAALTSGNQTDEIDTTAATPALAAGPVTSATVDVTTTPDGTDGPMTVDVLELIDSQSDEVAHLLRDLVAETAG